jgi:hypothetical protein
MNINAIITKSMFDHSKYPSSKSKSLLFLLSCLTNEFCISSTVLLNKYISGHLWMKKLDKAILPSNPSGEMSKTFILSLFKAFIILFNSLCYAAKVLTLRIASLNALKS